ncbi:MAG TPA: alpha/beta hydrolase [Candidatus Saccharimonadales bacterium]|nr:alpha/beta hydrolase [Candidatus Saccharimonadales bacterium]
MAKQKADPSPAAFIEPLNMNGLMGRMLRLPSKKRPDRELLVIYGHHAKLERWWGLIQNFADFGNVTMPDLPGFGGMDSFYKIGQKPTIDNLADYLAAFIKLRYKRRRLMIVGISFGFVIATRMLQRCPELAKRVDVVISCVGFAHHDDFNFTRRRMFMYRSLARLVSLPIITTIFRVGFLNQYVLRYAYTHTHNAKHKFEEAAANGIDMYNAVMETEIELWRINDLKTHLYTTSQFLHVDNCRQLVDAPVWHVSTVGDYYFNNQVVEQHLRIIFSSYTGFELRLDTHAPSVVATKKEAAPFIPAKLRRALS